MTIQQIAQTSSFVYALCNGQKDGSKGLLEYSVVYQRRGTAETCAWCKQDGRDKVGIYQVYAKYVGKDDVWMDLPICLTHVASAIADL